MLQDMQDRLDALPPERSHRQFFLGTYLRTTRAVGDAVETGRFQDPTWVVRWDVAFADLYLTAHDADADGRRVPRPWRLAFAADRGLPALRHILLGINAHVNYDLPQAMLAVISPADFLDATLLDRRRFDHARIDDVLASRVAAEDSEIATARSLTDRLLGPLNRIASRRFLREAREKVWLNVEQLHSARLQGPEAYRRRLSELEVLSAAKVADLLAPGQVLLRLAVAGFGVVLPPA